MIGRLSGKLVEKFPPWILLDVAGVGYEVQIPVSTLAVLPEAGGECTLWTHLSIREDAHALYGFSSKAERTLFRNLIKVSGIGPKIGLAVLSSVSTEEFLLAVQSQEPGRLVKIPGIGKKTAERLLLELKGKLTELGRDVPAGVTQPQSQLEGVDEILAALCALGYSDKEAIRATKEIPAGTGVTEGLKLALKQLSTG